MQYKPAATITTGTFWELFFLEIEKKIQSGEKVDLSFATAFTMGGSGTTPEKYAWMNKILMDDCHGKTIINGYGLSEVIGVLSVQKEGTIREHQLKDSPIIDVGIPLPGFVVSVHDENGNELKYGERGELWVSSPTVMHGYYNKPELTAATLINGQIHTGDLCAIDKDGYIYVYGRIRNNIVINGKTTYLFDIADTVRMQFDLAECMVEKKELENRYELVMYLAQWKDKAIEEEKLINQINDFFIGRFSIAGYKTYLTALPANPATLKPRTNDLTGFVNYKKGKKEEVAYEKLVTGKLKRI